MIAIGFGNKSIAQNKETKLELSFSQQGGFYNDSISVSLYAIDASIYYTLDGSLPTEQSPQYTTELNIHSSTVIRAIAINEIGKRSKVEGHTYFINEPNTSFPTVSLAIPPDLLFNPESGLFMQGAHAQDSLYSKPGANFWSRREMLIHTEMFDVDQSCFFNSESGLRLFGGMSRLFPQKSLSIVARDRYGKKRIRHRVFGKKGLKSFKFLVLRNSGSDWGKSHLRDAFMTKIVSHWDMEMQDYQPAHVYINGSYWGIYNIREKINKYFLEDHTGEDREHIDLIEHKITLKKGSSRHYRQMLEFIENNSMADPTNYAHLEELMDIDNFRNYQIAQIYFDNRDAGGNIKFWRPQTANGRWRWILFDTDWGFGLHDTLAYQHNSLAFHTEPNGPKWPNPPWSTLILRKLLENPKFERE